MKETETTDTAYLRNITTNKIQYFKNRPLFNSFTEGVCHRKYQKIKSDIAVMLYNYFTIHIR